MTTTLYYTHKTEVTSAAINALYYDEVLGDIYVEFHNGTIVHRYFTPDSFERLDEIVENNGGSLGSAWNNDIKYMKSHDYYYTVDEVEFVQRADVTVNIDPTDVVSVPKDEDVATEADVPQTLDILLRVEASWADLTDIVGILEDAGYSPALLGAVR